MKISKIFRVSSVFIITAMLCLGLAAPASSPAVASEIPAAITDWAEGFDDITNLPGWFMQNNSEPPGVTDWFQGNDTVFPAHQGAPTAYIGANYNNTAGVGTISNWLLTPETTFNNGDTFSFWTRTATGSSWPDRLELRWSGNGASTDVGTGAFDLGDFATLLLAVNPDLDVGGYPEVWTQYSVEISGLAGPTNGRIGFRYFVTNAGPSGSNSNYIGIDTVEYVAAPSNPAIELSKTVGTVPGVCADTDEITVDAGTEVYYCFQVENTGDVTLNFHSLVDSELGTILDGLPYVLEPGVFSPEVIVPATPLVTTVNTATWTAYNELYGVSDAIPYNFEDISGTGTLIPLTDDSVSPAIPIGFDFHYYLIDYTDIYVSSNGFITVLPGQPNGCCTGGILPDTATPNGTIAGWWEDLNPSAGGTVHYQTLGTAPNRYFIVQFTDIPHFGGGNLVTKQYKLFEGSNYIEVHYMAAPSDGGTHSAGIENETGTEGIQYYRGTASLPTPLAVRYFPTPPGYAEASATATVNVLVPEIAVSPSELGSWQPYNQVVEVILEVANVGAGNLNWMIEEAPPVAPAAPAQSGASSSGSSTASIDVVTDASQCALYEKYVGAEPVGYAEHCLGITVPVSTNAGVSPFAPTDTGYAQDIGFVSDNFVSFTLNDFPGQTVIGPNTLALFGMDFDPTATILYALDNTGQQLGTMDLSSGAFTAIGPSIPLGAHTWTGLTIDPVNGTFYASSTDGATAALYTLNPATGAATLINTQTTTPLLIDIAMNMSGVMYGHDISTDSIYTIDPATAAATLVGPTGYNGNFAQGMDFDNDDGTLYIFLYIGGGANVYGTVNLATGAVTPLATDNPLGEFEGAIQIAGVASACSSPADVPWLSVSPTSGTTAAGASTPVSVYFDSNGLAVGTYTANLCVFSNDIVSPVTVVPVELHVYTPTFVRVVHLAPFAEDASVSVTFNVIDELPGIEYGDSTGYHTFEAGLYDVAVTPTGAVDPAIEATFMLEADTYYTILAVGDGVNQDLDLIMLTDDLTAPAAGTFHLRLGHLAPFAAGPATADIRLQDGTPVLLGVDFSDVTGFIPLAAGEYDLKITTPGGDVTLIDPLPVVFTEGMIISAFATGEGVNQPLGVYALPAYDAGFFLPLYEEPQPEGYIIYLPIVNKNLGD
jgi:hypothetical protein